MTTKTIGTAERRGEVSSFSPERGSEVSSFVAMVAMIAAIGGGLFGYDTGVVSGAIRYIKKDFPVSAATEGLIVAAVTVGALVAAMIAGVLADRGGRRLTNIARGLVFATASLLCVVANSVPTLIAGRFLVGCGIGLTSVGAPMYIAEVSPARVRGTFVSLFQLAVTLGILLSYVVCAMLAPAAAWRWMLGLAAVPGLALAIGMMLMPESPRWLFRRHVFHLCRPRRAHPALRHREGAGDQRQDAGGDQ